MLTILLVDDDRVVVQILTDALSRYETVFASDGRAALHQLGAEHPDLVLTDLRLPDIDGLLLIGKIRALSQVPIITLSARHEQSDVVMALQAGADDCIRKPFDIDDLLARVDAVLRRSARLPIMPAGEIRVGELVVSHRRRGAIVGGHVILLTPTELRLLTLLADNHGKVVDRHTLAREVWGYDDSSAARQIEVHIGRLRGKLKLRQESPLIVTTRGKDAGYMLEGES